MVLLILVYVYFIMSDLVYFVHWNIVTLNGGSAVMTFLSDWMSSLFTCLFLLFLPWLFFTVMIICLVI